MPIVEYKGKKPEIDEKAFVFSNATLIGDIKIAKTVLVLANAVLRGDFDFISVGERTCIQENAVLNPVPKEPIIIEGNSIIGYGAIMHGGRCEKGVFVGMNAVIMQGVRIGEESVIAAGSVITEGIHIPRKSLVAGVPAKILKELSDKDIEWARQGVITYMGMLREYRKSLKRFEIRSEK